MQTLVLRIPDELALDLQAEAQRRNSTKSAVARARLAASVKPEAGPGFGLISDLIGKDESQPRDLSARKKHYLKARGYGREKASR